jgi:hypothetical protein
MLLDQNLGAEAPRPASTHAADTPVKPALTTTTSLREGSSAGGVRVQEMLSKKAPI